MKELKDRSFCPLTHSAPEWNPVKELKEVERVNDLTTRISWVESGEGIERLIAPLDYRNKLSVRGIR